MAHRIAEKQTKLAPLRVLHRGVAMVPDYRALMEAHTRRHVGVSFDPTVGPPVLLDDDESKPTGQNHGGFFRRVDHVVTIAATDPHYREYVRHIKDGDLWAADVATAVAAGVEFEPDFGDEHPETAGGEEAVAVRKEREEQTKRGVEEAKKAEAAAKAEALKSAKISGWKDSTEHAQDLFAHGEVDVTTDQPALASK